MTLMRGYLWCNITSSDDVQRALKYYEEPIKEIRAATELKEPLKGFEGAKIFFERDVPAGHVFLVIGD